MPLATNQGSLDFPPETIRCNFGVAFPLKGPVSTFGGSPKQKGGKWLGRSAKFASSGRAGVCRAGTEDFLDIHNPRAVLENSLRPGPAGQRQAMA